MIYNNNQEKSHLISVVMPAFNAARFIKKTIESVQLQTIHDWELIVMDDCSTDETVAVVTGLAELDSRIKVFSNETNMGVAKTRNCGMDYCRGEYIALLDCDDLWYPNKLELQLACFRETNADLVYTSYAIVDFDGNKQCNDFIVPPSIDFDGLLKKNVISSSAVMLTKSVASRFRFPEDYYHEDYALWLQILRSGCKAVGVTDVLGAYYVHADSKAGNKQKSAIKRWRIYRDYLKFPVWKSLWYFSHYALAGLRKYKKSDKGIKQ